MPYRWLNVAEGAEIDNVIEHEAGLRSLRDAARMLAVGTAVVRLALNAASCRTRSRHLPATGAFRWPTSWLHAATRPVCLRLWSGAGPTRGGMNRNRVNRVAARAGCRRPLRPNVEHASSSCSASEGPCACLP